jgi:hypothetical protein
VAFQIVWQGSLRAHSCRLTDRNGDDLASAARDHARQHTHAKRLRRVLQLGGWALRDACAWLCGFTATNPAWMAHASKLDAQRHPEL